MMGLGQSWWKSHHLFSLSSDPRPRGPQQSPSGLFTCIEITQIIGGLCWETQFDTPSISWSHFRLSLDHPCLFRNSPSQHWQTLFVSQIQAACRVQMIFLLRTEPSDKHYLPPAIRISWPQKEATLVSAGLVLGCLHQDLGEEGAGWRILTSSCDAPSALAVLWPGALRTWRGAGVTWESVSWLSLASSWVGRNPGLGDLKL